MSCRDATWVLGLFLFLFVFVFIFFNRATAHTREPIFAHNSSKDAVWCKEDPFGVDKCVILKFWCVLPPKHSKNDPKLAITSQIKMSNNFKTVRDTRNMSMNHDCETGVALSDSVNKTCVKRPQAEKSWWRHFRLAIKPRYLENQKKIIKSYYGFIMVSLSECVMKNCLKHPWRRNHDDVISGLQ